jgi:hypothetical protein
VRGVKGEHTVVVHDPGDVVRSPLHSIGMPVIKTASGLYIALILELLITVSVDEVSAESIRS